MLRVMTYLLHLYLVSADQLAGTPLLPCTLPTARLAVELPDSDCPPPHHLPHHALEEKHLAAAAAAAAHASDDAAAVAVAVAVAVAAAAHANDAAAGVGAGAQDADAAVRHDQEVHADQDDQRCHSAGSHPADHWWVAELNRPLSQTADHPDPYGSHLEAEYRWTGPELRS